MKKPKDFKEYCSWFPAETQKLLKQLRLAIKKAAPKAEEVISYGMPSFKQNGMLVYYAAYKNHLGFYPTGKGITAFQKEVAKYKWSKGTVQFPLDKPLPIRLITRIVKYRVKENQFNVKLKREV